MQGNLNINNNNLLSVNKIDEKISVSIPTYTTVTTDGTLTLTSNSTTTHFITGSATGYSVVFPNATTLTNGTNYEIYNRSSNSITLKYNDGSPLAILDLESVSSLILQDNSTGNGVFSPFTVEVAQAAGIENYSLSTSTAFATSSATDVQITGFTVTPKSGEYLMLFNSSNSSTNNNSDNAVSLYKNSTQIAGSERNAKSTASNFIFILSTQAVASFNGTDQLRVYARVSTGTLTVSSRTITMLRLGPASA
jgi:hypothetical protein